MSLALTPHALFTSSKGGECVSSLAPRLLSCRKTGREPGRTDYMPCDVLCVVHKTSYSTSRDQFFQALSRSSAGEELGYEAMCKQNEWYFEHN